MILDDAFERFSQKYPMSVMARGIMENALNPRDPRSALRRRRGEAVHPQAAFLRDRRPNFLLAGPVDFGGDCLIEERD
jgi:hypothetical protein